MSLANHWKNLRDRFKTNYVEWEAIAEFEDDEDVESSFNRAFQGYPSGKKLEDVTRKALIEDFDEVPRSIKITGVNNVSYRDFKINRSRKKLENLIATGDPEEDVEEW